MDKFTYTKRRENDFVIHLAGEVRGICTTWEEAHANLIVNALNAQPCEVSNG